jgi:hypothetical protein
MLAGELTAPLTDYQKLFELHLGSNAFAYNLSQLNEGINLKSIINLGFDYPFRIRFDEGKVLISAEVRNQAGDLVAEIIDNNWAVNSNTTIAHDKNFNEYAFEVIDSNSIPILQVSVRNFNEIHVGGLFYVPNGRLLIGSSAMTFNPLDRNIREQLKPMFRYPSYDLSFAILVFASGAVLGTLGTILVSWGFALRKQNTRTTKRPRKKTADKSPQKGETKSGLGLG